MSDTPKRRFWQFRLSTAVVLMLIASSLLMANVGGSLGDASKCGFPFPMYWHQAPPYPLGQPVETCAFGPFEWSYKAGWSYRLVIANILVSMLSLAGAAVASEWLIRRREGRMT